MARKSEEVNRLLFDYEELGEERIGKICRELPPKILRWLGAHHPDNRTRKIFFRLTGVEIGEGAVINGNFVVSDGYRSLLRIGRRVAIAPNVTVICESHPNNSRLASIDAAARDLVRIGPVELCDDAWIGSGAVILPGVVIGESAVVAAGAVVTETVPPRTIAAGVPARVVRPVEAGEGEER